MAFIEFLDYEDLIFELDDKLDGFNYTKRLSVNKLKYEIDDKLQIDIDNFENDYPEYYID
jgi:hypothetical protein